MKLAELRLTLKRVVKKLSDCHPNILSAGRALGLYQIAFRFLIPVALQRSAFERLQHSVLLAKPRLEAF